MAAPTFNTTAGQTVARELLIAYINVATTGASGSPKWAAIGKRVEDSSEEMDWGEETIQDIIGNTYTTMKKPTLTQSFDPLPLDAGDEASKHIWNLAVYEQNAQALANQDMLIVHQYVNADGSSGGSFAERYDSCAVRVTGLGGEGGGNIDMPIEVTYGGNRTVGSAAVSGGTVTFTAGAAVGLSAAGSPVTVSTKGDK